MNLGLGSKLCVRSKSNHCTFVASNTCCNHEIRGKKLQANLGSQQVFMSVTFEE